MGATSVTLSGVASNCTVGGQNPRPVTITAGGTADLLFVVTCSATTGAVAVTTTTTGTPVDPSGYTVSVDGGAAIPIATSASQTFSGLAAGAHSVELGGLDGNCAVQGQNPREFTVVAGQTAAVAFAVDCSAVTGSLAVTVAGLPAGVEASVAVSGPGGYSEALSATTTLGGLAPGQYSVTGEDVVDAGLIYTPSPASQQAAVAAGEVAAVTLTYAPVASTLNLRIAGFHLSQSIQTFANDLPLVAGRDAFLRVYPLANESNSATPQVRVRLFDAGTLVQTFTVEAPGGTVPTERNDALLGSTWNLLIPGSLIQPGLEVLADVDPDNAVSESDESDNVYPGPDRQLPVQVRVTPALSITLLPVRQSANDLEGEVTEGNAESYVQLAQRIYPISAHDTELHEAYTTTTLDALLPDDANGAWNTVLSEVLAVWIAESSDRHYYGVVRTGYSSGLVGNGFLETPVAIGYDAQGDRGRIAAHELGHTWGRLHSPCGGPADQDPDFPYPDGNIERIGYDLADEEVVSRQTPDIMGYCQNAWISDYTYRAVMNFRGSPLLRSASSRPVPALLVWGRIVNGRAVLEPAFRLTMRPALPTRPGPYTVEGTAADGSRVFGVSFSALETGDGRRGAGHFAFAIPLDDRGAERLERIAVAGPGLSVTAVARPPAALRAAAAQAVRMTRTGAGAELEWDAAANPMVMVRNPRTGEVLSFARGGRATVRTSGEVEMIVSDGVRSSAAPAP